MIRMVDSVWASRRMLAIAFCMAGLIEMMRSVSYTTSCSRRR